jgi:hypothetical protein
MKVILGVALFVCTALGVQARTSEEGKILRSRATGLWSDPMTWEGGLVPAAGARVQIRAGHTVTYDLVSETTIRFIHVAGVLTFAPDRNTQLDVGLIKVEQREDASENGFGEARRQGQGTESVHRRALHHRDPRSINDS